MHTATCVQLCTVRSSESVHTLTATHAINLLHKPTVLTNWRVRTIVCGEKNNTFVNKTMTVSGQMLQKAEGFFIMIKKIFNLSKTTTIILSNDHDDLTAM